MSLRRGQEGEMVATMGDSCVHDGENIPEPGDGKVGAHYDRTQGYWEEVREDLFKRMAIDGGYSNRSCPLVVRLVDVFVETRVVEYPMCVSAGGRGEGNEEEGEGRGEEGGEGEQEKEERGSRGREGRGSEIQTSI